MKKTIAYCRASFAEPSDPLAGSLHKPHRRFGTLDAGAMAGKKGPVLVAGYYPHELLCAIA
jgi:hypothetical protein